MLASIIAFGSESVSESVAPAIVCADGFKVSVQASWRHYCRDSSGYRPEPNRARGTDAQLPYIEVEVGFPSERPEPWPVWSDYAEDRENPIGTVYAYVPVDIVTRLIDLHGGEV